MKRVKAFIMATAMAGTICLILTGCTKDRGFSTMKIYTPVYKSTADVRAAIKTGEPQPVAEAGKMFIQGNYIFLNEVNRGIHIIDNTNPAAPVNKAFITIPGNNDVFAKGNVLYADSYTDLLAIDISNVEHIQLKTYLHNIFPSRNFVLGTPVPDGMIIANWQVRDTTIKLDIQPGQGIWKNSEYFYNGGIYFDGQGVGPTSIYTLASSYSPKAYGSGTGGSTSRITIINNYLYAVDASLLSSINISDALSPKLANTNFNAINAQTIFALNNTLFLGGSIGMAMFSVDGDPATPVADGVFGHFCSNDPVIADGNTAYVTLHASTSCNANINELEVIDVTDIKQPVMLKAYPLNGPIGLSKDGNYLFVCDSDGLKIFDATQPTDLKFIKTVNIDKPYDVICLNKIAYVSTAGGLYQLDYSNIDNIKQLSKIIMSY